MSVMSVFLVCGDRLCFYHRRVVVAVAVIVVVAEWQ
jgi:hypothetical protein